jgi:membrane protein YdbS with pleckstrin-like domain
MIQGADDQGAKSFRPAEGYLRYLKFQFWILLFIIDVALFIGWIILLANAPGWVSMVLTVPIWILIIVPDIIAYVAIHLRYDTTWYALSDRSMRIRRGIWVIHETTITYENIQNVTVNQGPLQRYFGISDVQVETAGGGSSPHGQPSTGHQGSLEGVDCPEEVRQLILLKWKQSKSAGLGDDREHALEIQPQQFGNSRQVELLEEIRDLAAALAN